MPEPVVISAAVEGLVDEAVVRKVIACAGGQAGSVYGTKGKPALRKGINGFNHAARHARWVVLVDLNSDKACAPALRQCWLPAPAPLLCFRIAVRQVEAWLMADGDTLAQYLRVARSAIPRDPETLVNAKTEMVNLARCSKRRDIRTDMLPRKGSGRAVGPAYTSRLIEYVQTAWRPREAAQRSDSLRRALACLERLVREAS
jgi:hypothetical protein